VAGIGRFQSRITRCGGGDEEGAGCEWRAGAVLAEARCGASAERHEHPRLVRSARGFGAVVFFLAAETGAAAGAAPGIEPQIVPVEVAPPAAGSRWDVQIELPGYYTILAPERKTGPYMESHQGTFTSKLPMSGP
jgi:hypothetical protein